MNPIQIKILRRLRDHQPQWATGFSNVKLIMRSLKQAGMFKTEQHIDGGILYKITNKGRKALRQYES